VPIYRLDTSDVDGWNTNVLAPAVDILKEWLRRIGSETTTSLEDFFTSLPHADKLLMPSLPPSSSSTSGKRKRGSGQEEEKEDGDAEAKWKNYTCDVCRGRVLRGAKEWEAHLKSRGHKICKRKKARPAKPAPSHQQPDVGDAHTPFLGSE